MFSSQGSESSQALSRGLLFQIYRFFHIGATPESVKLGNFLLRKAAHFTVYFVLGAGLCGLFHGQTKVRPWIPALLVGAAFAATDEFHQLFTGRTAMVWDVLLDSCGVAAGCLAVSLLWKRLAKKRG